MRCLLLLLCTSILSINLDAQNKSINESNIEQYCIRFFSQHILENLNFIDNEKIYFSGNTEAVISSFSKSDELLILNDSLISIEEQFFAKNRDTTNILTLNTDDLDKNYFNFKKKKKKNYELIIYRTLKLNKDVYFTKLRISNGQKGAVIFILIDNKRFTYQIKPFIF